MGRQKWRPNSYIENDSYIVVAVINNPIKWMARKNRSNVKTHKEEIEEVIDMVIKLTWCYTIFRALFEKSECDCEVRATHPELFLTLHDSMLSAFCVNTAVIFDDKSKATSIWSLVNQSAPGLAAKLTQLIGSKSSSIKSVEALRNQVFAHRFQAKSPVDVFAEVRPHLSIMTEIVDLAKTVICELIGEFDSNRRAELERQQLSEQTLNSMARDAHSFLKALGQTSETM